MAQPGLPDYSLVLGVDPDHLPHLDLVLPTWTRHKPSVLNRPVFVFFPPELMGASDIRSRLPEARCIPWEPRDEYGDFESLGKWGRPQRYRMLAGFVHVPPAVVQTKYWLKLDLDVIADGPDDWIDPEWFRDDPAIVSHPWGYTKPADQMLQLDAWVDQYAGPLNWMLSGREPLRLSPAPGSDIVRHKRIISWCGFFNRHFSKACSGAADMTVGRTLLPVPSQDGFHWYCATRAGLTVRRENMKSRGWIHRSSLSGIRQSIAELQSR